MGPARIFSEMFYPSGIKCVVCGDDLPESTRYCVCERCKLDFNTKFCLKCGRAMKNMAEYCDDCQNHGFTFETARAPFVYENEVVGLIRRLKFGSGKYLSGIMAQFMTDVYVDSNFSADAAVFVPMLKRKQRARGYNQAEEIAKAFSGFTGIPVIDALERVKKTGNFARMNKRQRAEAIKDSIALKDDALIKDRNLVLIDDVFTTGATAEECSRVLKSAGCGKIFVLTFATSRIRIELY